MERQNNLPNVPGAAFGNPCANARRAGNIASGVRLGFLGDGTGDLRHAHVMTNKRQTVDFHDGGGGSHTANGGAGHSDGKKPSHEFIGK